MELFKGFYLSHSYSLLSQLRDTYLNPFHRITPCIRVSHDSSQMYNTRSWFGSRVRQYLYEYFSVFHNNTVCHLPPGHWRRTQSYPVFGIVIPVFNLSGKAETVHLITAHIHIISRHILQYISGSNYFSLSYMSQLFQIFRFYILQKCDAFTEIWYLSNFMVQNSAYSTER